MRGIEEVSSCALDLGYFFLALRRGDASYGHAFRQCIFIGVDWSKAAFRCVVGKASSTLLMTMSVCRLSGCGSISSAIMEDLISRGF